MFYVTMPSGVLLSGCWTPTKECPFRSPDTVSDISPRRRPRSTRAPLRYTINCVFELSFRRHHIAAYATFRRVVANTRKEKGLSQKELAARIKREDGAPISSQYLNDIEHDRRSPSSDQLVKQFAEVLDIDLDYLYYLAPPLPP